MSNLQPPLNFAEFGAPAQNNYLRNYISIDIARHDFVMWRSAGKPRFGKICLSMNQSRLRFKSALKYCQQNEIKMRADSLARSMMNNDMTGFWKDVHKITNSKVPLATKVDGCVGDTNIAEMWKCHYKSLLNSVENKNCKKSACWTLINKLKTLLLSHLLIF